MKRTTNFTGALSSASNSIPPDDLPNAATTSSSRSDEQCGMAIPNPMPVLIVSSRCLSEARMLSRSAGLIFPRLTSRSISSTMAGQRSVAFISGMICSAESKLASAMQDFPVGTGSASLPGAVRLTSAFSDGYNYTVLNQEYRHHRALYSLIAAQAASARRTCRWWHGGRDCPSRTCFYQTGADDDSQGFPRADSRHP